MNKSVVTVLNFCLVTFEIMMCLYWIILLCIFSLLLNFLHLGSFLLLLVIWFHEELLMGTKDTVKSKSVSFLGASGMWWFGIRALLVLLLVYTCLFFRSFGGWKSYLDFWLKKKEFKDILHLKAYFVWCKKS